MFHIYIYIYGIDPHDYRGLQVPRSATGKLETQETPLNQESQWCSFTLEARRLEIREATSSV